MFWGGSAEGGLSSPPGPPSSAAGMPPLLVGGRDAAAPAGFYEGGGDVSIGGAISSRPVFFRRKRGFQPPRLPHSPTNRSRRERRVSRADWEGRLSRRPYSSPGGAISNRPAGEAISSRLGFWGGVVFWRGKCGGGTIVPPRSPLFGGRDAAAPVGFYEGGGEFRSEEGRFPIARRERRFLVAPGSGGVRVLAREVRRGDYRPPPVPPLRRQDAAAPACFYECGNRFGDLFAMTSAT